MYLNLHKYFKYECRKSKIFMTAFFKKKEPNFKNIFESDQWEMKKYYEYHFDIEEKDALLTEKLNHELKKWKHRSGLKRAPSFESGLKKYQKSTALQKNKFTLKTPK